MRPNNSIEKIRKNAWFLLGLDRSGLWDPFWAGEDLMGFDDLVTKVYEELKQARKVLKKGKALEAVAAAMFRIEEFYDIPPGGKIPPSKRPPEITAQLKAQGLIA